MRVKMFRAWRLAQRFIAFALAMAISACSCPTRTIQVFKINEASTGSAQGCAYLFVNDSFIHLLTVDGKAIPQPDFFNNQLATAYTLDPGLHSVVTDYAASSSSTVGTNRATTTWQATAVTTPMSAEAGHIYSVTYDKQALLNQNLYKPVINDCGAQQLPAQVVGQCALNDYMPLCERLKQ